MFMVRYYICYMDRNCPQNMSKTENGQKLKE